MRARVGVRACAHGSRESGGTCGEDTEENHTRKETSRATSGDDAAVARHPPTDQCLAPKGLPTPTRRAIRNRRAPGAEAVEVGFGSGATGARRSRGAARDKRSGTQPSVHAELGR